MVGKSKTSSNNLPKKGPFTDSFLETLRNFGPGIAQEAKNQVFSQKTGELKPEQILDLQKERQRWGIYQDYLDIRRQEKIIWTKKQQETELQIKAILAELQKLAQITSNLAKEVKIATQQVPVEPGVYHISFFEKLRQTILLFKQHIEQATNWLNVFNQRAKKRNYYWAQVRKSGTKFMLSQERHMATQTG